MRRLFFKKHLFLLLSLLFFVLSFSVWYFFVFNSSKSNDQRSVNTITEKVNHELRILAEEGSEIRNIIKTSDKPSFSTLVQVTKYPYFVFRNRGLYFWSDNSFAPNYESLNGNYQFRLVQLRNGKYVVHREHITTRGDLFEIYSFLPLSSEYSLQNNYISSGLNKDIFSLFPFRIDITPGRQGNNIRSYKGEFLFSLGMPKDHDYRNEALMLLLVILIGVGIVFIVLYLVEWMLLLEKQNKPGFGILMLSAGLLGIRAVMLGFSYPFTFYEFDLFNSKYFASSSISPSLGDLLLNMVMFVLIASFVFRFYHSTKPVKMLMKLGEKGKLTISVVLSFLSFFALYMVFYLPGVLSYHSQWSLDITSDLDFNIFRIISILIFICAFVVYFIISHILFRLLISLNIHRRRRLLMIFATGAFLYLICSLIDPELSKVIIGLNAVYFLVLYYLKLPHTIGNLKYSTYLYYLFCALVCSVTGAYSIYRQNLSKSVFDKQHYATDLLFKNDVFGEYLLNEASGKIKNDRFTQYKFVTPLSSKGIIEHKIKRVFLSNYFDKYDVLVSVFGPNGEAYERQSDYATWHEAVQKYKSKKYKTDYPDIYFIADPETGARRYINFNEIKIDGQVVGYIVIELKHKKVIPHSVYPELLVNGYFEKTLEPVNYSSAVFARNKLLYSTGNVNYAANFNIRKLDDPDLYKEGIISKGYHHLGIKGGDGKIIVVSSDRYTFKRIFSNFSFLFLLLIFFILLFIVLYAWNFRSRTLSNATYATRIQIYLNIAFFLPLLIVSITTLSIISVSYKDSINNAFVKKAEDISSSISGYMQEKRLNGTQKERLENVLEQIGKYTESDINLFNNRGRLIFTNQPMIFDLGFLSRLIEPEVYASMVENTANLQMLSEKIGDLKYNAVYVSIKSAESNELLGILSMPFFESKNELDKQIIHVLTTIVNIFVTIFILFLSLSYFASQLLTVPLKIITQKLKKTTLEKNEPIEWKTHDEIGMLVGEYNSMLIKLEESKEALSKNEKESAWREMAKQVAHEIKNPLTPMKLTIQHLQRSVQAGDDELPEKTQKALNVLLDQVNNLNEIATSFSLFAKMPIPKSHRFEISSVLLKTAALHNNSNEVSVEMEVETGEFYVTGDEQLMSGIFTNLILNAIQSVPHDRTPEIKVKLTRQDVNVLIEVKDNGSGIPEHIRDKVFLPNFSTKFAGSGIGLAVAKRGVEHAGGRIWFETVDDAGTSFFLEIPLTD